MGGIIGANYVTKYGTESGLTSCVSISGCFDTRENMSFWHSLHLWQPVLARSLKENFAVPNVHKLAARCIDLRKVEQAVTVVDVDRAMVAPYHGYKRVEDYYIDMSAGVNGKILGLRTPLLAIHALDDPIMTPGGTPVDAVDSVEDLFILLTRQGGHVGWPLGWFPTQQKWAWMTSSSLDFSEGVVDVIRKT
ncbi:unnamed protein product [Choristocarpus tenellus]